MSYTCALLALAILRPDHQPARFGRIDYGDALTKEDMAVATGRRLMTALLRALHLSQDKSDTERRNSVNRTSGSREGRSISG
ncbi:MAG: hypothetical protein EON59_01585 [Alphaproteobacteria bacterium]|nr:MAG: hypothetical protein EON59_01585 [Alphaproteobacteria bacterium]